MLVPDNVLQTGLIDRARAYLVMFTAQIMMAVQFKGGIGLQYLDYDYDAIQALCSLLAFARYPETAPTFTGIDAWISSSWPDLLVGSVLTATGSSPSVGCKLLFLYYPRYQLGYPMADLFKAPVMSLLTLYQNIAKVNLDPFPASTALLATRFQPDVADQIQGCANPFPYQPPQYPSAPPQQPVKIPPVVPPPVRAPQTTCAELQSLINELELKTDKTVQETETLQTYKDWYSNQCSGFDPGKIVDPTLNPKPFLNP